MAKDLFKDGNYVIVVDENGYQREFPMGKTVYSEKDDSLIITEGQIEGQEITITLADSVNWTDDLSVPYTAETMRQFMRDNTGFNVASGGNGAGVVIEKVINLSSAQINSMGSVPIELAPISGVGKYYRIDNLSIEFTRGNTDFDGSAVDYITVLNNSSSHRTLIDKGLLSIPFGSLGDMQAVSVNSFGQVATTPSIIFFQGGTLNSNVLLGTRNNGDYSLGDGSAKVKIKLTLITAV